MTSRHAKAALLAISLTLGLVTLAQAEISQKGDLRVSFEGKLTPHALPRSGTAPVKVAVGAKIAATDSQSPPQLRQIAIAINRNGRFTPAGLPRCTLKEIQPSTAADALAACRASLVGEGSFSAKVLLPEQAPFPSKGKVFAFNGRFHGAPAILAHVYGENPVPITRIIVFHIRHTRGTYGTVLTAALPASVNRYGYLERISLDLHRNFTYRGAPHSYLSAACDAPPGFPGATFPLARASMTFADGHTLSSTLTRSCRVRG
jgi:hypothetical protein